MDLFERYFRTVFDCVRHGCGYGDLADRARDASIAVATRTYGCSRVKEEAVAISEMTGIRLKIFGAIG